MRSGEIVVFGSAALAFRLPDAPETRDVDIWCSPAEAGKAIEALMGELSWYHDRNGSYVEVWGPETFRAPSDWRTRARLLTDDQLPELRLVVPHPHDTPSRIQVEPRWLALRAASGARSPRSIQIHLRQADTTGSPDCCAIIGST